MTNITYTKTVTATFTAPIASEVESYAEAASNYFSAYAPDVVTVTVGATTETPAEQQQAA